MPATRELPTVTLMLYARLVVTSHSRRRHLP
jgi:hypothetical protein